MTPEDRDSANVGEDALHAAVDGRLPAEEAQALAQRLAGDADALAKLEAWRTQREALRGLHRHLLDEPMPASLLAAATRADGVRARSGLWWRWGGIAASVALAFASGWLTHAQWPGAGSGQQLAAAPARAFARQAAVAHVVYSPEVRHPVEVTADQQQHLVQWLSKRLDRPLKVPSLSAQGYQLVGGRLLPGDEGPRAQFMFEDASGTRVTLYIGAIRKPGAADARETAFSFAGDGPVPGFYWVDQGFGYALAGQLPRTALMQLAEAVYRQL